MPGATVTESRRASAYVRSRAGLGYLTVTAGVAVPTFAIAYANGGFDPETRAVAAISLWWGAALALVLGVFPLERVPRAAAAAGGLLAGYALLALLSGTWAASWESAFVEFARATMLLGVFVVAVLGSRRRDLPAWTDGIAAAASGIAVVALASRFFPDLFGSRGLAETLPSWPVRLSFPLGYWNGLAILCALGLPPLLRRAGDGHAAARGAAVAVLPALASVVFLASSRGGAGTALAGALAYLLVTSRRWAAAGALVVGGVGAAVAVAVLRSRTELVNGPLDADVVADQGRSAAALVGVVCVACGVAYALLALATRRLVLPRQLGIATAAVAAVAAAVVIVAANPVEQFRAFRQPPAGAATPQRDFALAHLTSANGSGRWQFWETAADQWQSRPVLGDGAGSYEAWWAQYGSLATFVRDAHSLYVETLGELGLVGFALVVGALGVGLVVGVRRAFASGGEERAAVAAVLAVLVGFAVAAGFDWVWELAAVSALGVLALGLLVGPATLPGPAVAPAYRWAGGLTVAAAVLVVCAQGVVLLSEVELTRSRDAAADGETKAALDHARAAVALQPWGASPHLQLALVFERIGRYAAARRELMEAAEKDPENWRIPYSAARIEVLAANPDVARRHLARARALNPRSPLFTTLTD